MRRVITQARDRGTSKKETVSSHHGSACALQDGETFAAVLGISRHEFPADLPRRQRRRAHIDAQNLPEPEILAHALMHHVLMHASTARIR